MNTIARATTGLAILTALSYANDVRDNLKSIYQQYAKNHAGKEIIKARTEYYDKNGVMQTDSSGYLFFEGPYMIKVSKDITMIRDKSERKPVYYFDVGSDGLDKVVVLDSALLGDHLVDIEGLQKLEFMVEEALLGNKEAQKNYKRTIFNTRRVYFVKGDESVICYDFNINKAYKLPEDKARKMLGKYEGTLRKIKGRITPAKVTRGNDERTD